MMRALWTQEVVNFKGRWHQITDAGLNPLPVQRPIPLWLGGRAEAVVKRVGRLADGWFPMVPPGPKLDEARAVIHEAAVAAGRDPAALGMEGRVNWADGVDELVTHSGRWREAGATHLSVNTMRAGLGAVDDHLAALATAAEALEISS